MNIVKPQHVKNRIYHIIGACFMMLNYMRYNVFGYTTPRTFPIDWLEQAVNYDFNVISRWTQYLEKYSHLSNPYKGKVVLELGPGPDLGIGLVLLALGARKYIALDVNELAKDTPKKFYKRIFDEIKNKYPECDIKNLAMELENCYREQSERLIYSVSKNFDVTSINEKIDLVVSQAAFEHFDDVVKVIEGLNLVANQGSMIVAEIDMETHTRWVKARDPLNIYRYGKKFWNTFKFSGSPNRMRSIEYRQLLERNGWGNVTIEPLEVLDRDYLRRVKPSLDQPFRYHEDDEMQILNFMLTASKNGTETG